MNKRAGAHTVDHSTLLVALLITTVRAVSYPLTYNSLKKNK